MTEQRHTYNEAASGTHVDFASLRVQPPTIVAGAAALTNATTVKIEAAPTAATNNRSLWVVAGAVLFGGTLDVSGRLTLTNTDDVDLVGVSGALIVGSDGTTPHLALDGNEIMAKASATTVADLRLQLEGGNLVIGTSALGVSYSASGSFNPQTSDGVALGTTALHWADLFLASLSVISFDNGDVTLTHSPNVLTMAGGDFALNGNLDFVGAQVITTSAGALSVSPAASPFLVTASTHFDQLGADGPLNPTTKWKSTTTHGLTTATDFDVETDDYLTFTRENQTTGGLRMQVLMQDAATATALAIAAHGCPPAPASLRRIPRTHPTSCG